MKDKMKKFGAWLLAAALAFAGAGAAQAESFEATSAAEIETAMGKAKSGDVIQITQPGTYHVQKLTGGGYLLAASVSGVTIEHTPGDHAWIAECGSMVVVSNLTWDVGVQGYQYCCKVSAVDCTIKGLFCCHTENRFERCTFVQEGTDYNMWTYSASVTYKDCTFKCNGKAVNVYWENHTACPLIVSDGCTFISGNDNKPAFKINSQYGPFLVAITDNNTIQSGFARGIVGYDSDPGEGDNAYWVTKAEFDANGKIIGGFANRQFPEIVAAYLGEGCTMTDNGDGTWKINGPSKGIEVVTPTVSEEKGITQEIVDQIAANPEVAKVEDTGLKAALAEDETLKDAEAVVKVELKEAAKDETGVLTFEIKPVVKGETETDISDKVAGKPITFRVPLTDAFTKFAKVTHKGEVDEISHVEVQGLVGSRYVELTFNHFSEVEFDPELAFPGLPEDAVKVADGFYQNGESDFYIISRAGLEAFRDAVDAGNTYGGKYIVLTADIDLGGENWNPIGDGTNQFKGSFDGQGHTISNLYIDGGCDKLHKVTVDTGKYVGLFAATEYGSVIKNLTIHNVELKGLWSCAGALVGGDGMNEATISGVNVTGLIKIGDAVNEYTGDSAANYVAGIIGKGYCKIDNCKVSGEDGSFIKSSNYYVGGIAGFIGEGVGKVISNCTVENIHIAGWAPVGGIIGIAHYGNTIENSKVAANVTVENYANIETESRYFEINGLGGIAGITTSGADVTVTGNTFAGKLVRDGELLAPEADCLHNKGLVGVDRNATSAETISQANLKMSNNVSSYIIPVVVHNTEEAQDALDGAKKGDTIVFAAGDYGTIYIRNNGEDANRILENVTLVAAENAEVTVDEFYHQYVGDKSLDVENLVIDGFTFDDPTVPAVSFDVSGNSSTSGRLRVNGLTVKNCTKVGNNATAAAAGQSSYNEPRFVVFHYDSATPPTVYAGDPSLQCGYHDIQILSNTITQVCQPICFPNSGILNGLTVVGNTFTDCTDNHIQKSGDQTSGAFIVKDNVIVNMSGRFARIAGATADATFTIENNTVTTPKKYDAGGDPDIFKITGAVGFTVTEMNNQWLDGSYSSGGATWIAAGDPALLPVTAVAEIFVGEESKGKYETVGAALRAAANFPGTAENPTIIQLTSGVVCDKTFAVSDFSLTYVTVQGSGDHATEIKNTAIQADGGKSVLWKGVTFKNIVFDNSHFRFSTFGLEDLTFDGNVFRNLDYGNTEAGVHFNLDSERFCKNLTYVNNLFDTSKTTSLAAINSQSGLTGNIVISNNVFKNSNWRSLQLQVRTNDGVDDNFLISDNWFVGNKDNVQIKGSGTSNGDMVAANINYNVFDETSDSIYFYNTDPDKTTVALDHNFWSKTPDANPAAFYVKGVEGSVDNIASLGVYPYYAAYHKEELEAGTMTVREALYNLVEPPVKDVALIGETKFASINAAFDAVNSQAGDDVTIKILCDFTEELTKDYEWTKDVLITTDKPDGVTVDLGFRYQRGLWCLLGDAHQMTIDDGVTILGLGQLCAGWGDAESAVDIDGDVTAQQLWAYVGTANINPTATIVLGYGDGMMKISDGGIVNVNGNLEEGAAATLDYATATPQVDVGYIQSYHYSWNSYNRLNLTDTYLRSTCIISPRGDSLIASLDNSVIYLNETTPPMIGWTTEANSKLELVNGSRVICEDTMTFDGEMSIEIGSQIKARGFINKGSLDIYAEGLVEPVKVVDYDGTGTMTLEDYGEVAVWDGKSWNGSEAYVEDNDLWVKPLVAPPEVDVKDESGDPEVKDAEGKEIPEDKQEAAKEKADDVKAEVTQTLAEPEVAKFEGTGVAEAATETKQAGEEQQIIEVKPEVVEALKDEAETEDEKKEITKDSKVESRVEIVFDELEVKVDTSAEEVKATETSVQYEVTPKVKTTVTVEGQEPKVVEAVIPNSVIAGNPIKFRLAVDSTFGGFARVRHTSSEDENFLEEYLAEVVTANDANGKKFVELSSDHFSTFKLTSTEETPVCRVGDKNYTSLADAIEKGGATAEIVLVANIELTENVTLGYNQTIDPGEFAISGAGTVKAADGYEVRIVNGKSVVYAKPTEVTVADDQKIAVCIEPLVLEQLSGKDALAAVQANGFQVWQNYVMGVDGEIAGNKLVPICKPNAENPGAAAVTITTPMTFGAAPAKTGIAVTYQLLKSATPKSGFTMVGKEQLVPVFAVDTSAEENATYWKIQAIFTPDAN